MPEPVPTPTAAQIVTFADIAMVAASAVPALLAADVDQAISDAKWAATLLDMEQWNKTGNKTGNIKRVGNIEFFEGTWRGWWLTLRNRIRLRYGLPALTASGWSGSPVHAGVTIAPDY